MRLRGKSGTLMPVSVTSSHPLLRNNFSIEQLEFDQKNGCLDSINAAIDSQIGVEVALA